MFPEVGLLLYGLFIGYLFKQDARRQHGVSTAIWVPLIWTTIIASRQVSYWLNLDVPVESPDDYLEGSPVDRTVYIILIVAGLFVLLRRNIAWSMVLKKNWAVIALFLYAGMSVLWSDFPFVSFKRWIKSVGHLVMIMVVLSDPWPRKAVELIFRRFSYMLIPLSIVFIKYFPALGRSYSLKGDPYYVGVTTHKNTLGHLCLASGLFFFWSLQTRLQKQKRRHDLKIILIDILFLVMVLWLFGKCDSATAFVSFVIGVLFLSVSKLDVFRRNTKSFETVFIVSLFCVILVFGAIGPQVMVSSMVDTMGHSDTFWGRVQLWEELLDFRINPLVGVGYESFWLGSRAVNLWETHWWRPNQAHNGYLETYLNLGLVGFFLTMLVIISAYKNAKTMLVYSFDYGRLLMTFVIVVVFFNVTEAALKGLHLFWFIVLMVATQVSRGYAWGNAKSL